ncbi:MAG: GNAT family N-acetyltransferase [Dehalococcoidia bacterium]
MTACAVRPLAPPDAPTCDAIIRSLPEFFGHEGGRADCVAAVRSQDGWVAEVDGRVIGFATWQPRTADAAEITWMAVHRDLRHTGAGTAIVERLVTDLAARGFRLAFAMTSAAHKQPVTGPDPYDDTRRFWVRRGFLPLTELDIWDTDIALILVRPLLPAT